MVAFLSAAFLSVSTLRADSGLGMLNFLDAVAVLCLLMAPLEAVVLYREFPGRGFGFHYLRLLAMNVASWSFFGVLLYLPSGWMCWWGAAVMLSALLCWYLWRTEAPAARGVMGDSLLLLALIAAGLFVVGSLGGDECANLLSWCLPFFEWRALATSAAVLPALLFLTVLVEYPVAMVLYSPVVSGGEKRHTLFSVVVFVNMVSYLLLVYPLVL